jgi:NAD(P)H dehydrogenase (quinone)
MTHDNQPRLFVTGATGQLGRLAIRELLKRVAANSIVAGVRSPDHEVARQFRAQGVEIALPTISGPKPCQQHLKASIDCQ